MKKIIEIENEGLESLLGERVTFFCLNYIYVGILEGVNKSCVLLKDPAIVYETGEFSSKAYKDEQSLCVEKFYIATNCIESYGVLK